MNRPLFYILYTLTFTFFSLALQLIFRNQVILFFFNLIIYVTCQIPHYKIEKSESLLKDSLVYNQYSSKIKSWKRPNDKTFNIQIGKELYVFNDGKFQKINNIFENQSKNHFKIAENYYYDDGSIPKLIVKVISDSIFKYPIEPFYFLFNNEKYVLQLFSNNSFVIINDSSFLAPLLYYENAGVKDKLAFFRNSNKNRLGNFVVKDSFIQLTALVDFFPRKDFFINEKRCLSYLPTMCQNKNQFFLTYSFLDSIFFYDLGGKLQQSVKLPNELTFKHYNSKNDVILNESSVEKSDLIGHNNGIIYYNDRENHILVVTIEGIDQYVNYPIIPTRNDMNWYISIYDLKHKKWIKTIKFDKSHEFRNIVFEGRNLYVKRRGVNHLVFNHYVY